MKTWINVKNGNKYSVLNDNVSNSTNSQDGQRMVLYHLVGTPEHLHVRSYDEFVVKFIPYHPKSA